METKNVERVRTHDGRDLTPLQLMREVKTAILLNPDWYSQNRVCMSEPGCGTPACIAGWMAHILDGHQDNAYESIHERVFGEYTWPWLFNASWAGNDRFWNVTPTPEMAGRAIDAYLQERGLL